jgi:hypothetical protein
MGDLLAGDQADDQVIVDAGVGDHAEFVPHARDPGPQLPGGPDRGRCRVVELVREVRRQGAELGQMLALAHGRLGGPDAEVQPVEQVHRHRQLCTDELAEVGRRQSQ